MRILLIIYSVLLLVQMGCSSVVIVQNKKYKKVHSVSWSELNSPSGQNTVWEFDGNSYLLITKVLVSKNGNMITAIDCETGKVVEYYKDNSQIKTIVNKMEFYESYYINSNINYSAQTTTLSLVRKDDSELLDQITLGTTDALMWESLTYWNDKSIFPLLYYLINDSTVVTYDFSLSKLEYFPIQGYEFRKGVFLIPILAPEGNYFVCTTFKANTVFLFQKNNSNYDYVATWKTVEPNDAYVSGYAEFVNNNILVISQTKRGRYSLCPSFSRIILYDCNIRQKFEEVEILSNYGLPTFIALSRDYKYLVYVLGDKVQIMKQQNESCQK